VSNWTQQEAVNLCVILESIAPHYGAHIALTGGCLYKPGERKDCDILIYRIRQAPEIDMDGLFSAFLRAGVEVSGGFGWCYKARYRGQGIDLFFPEEQGGEYISAEDRELQESLV